MTRIRALWSRRRMESRPVEDSQWRLDKPERETLNLGISPAEVRQDIRQALRGMFRRPALTVMVTAVLAVGIGACLTVFSILNTLFFRPLAYPQAERLVMVGEAYTRGQTAGPMAPVRWLDYLEWKQQAGSFSEIAAYRIQTYVLNNGGEPERLRGERVSASYFEMLGVRPMLGRGFMPEEYAAGAPAVIILSEEYWRRALGGPADVIGKTLRVDGAPATVVGVMPGGLRATLIEGGARLWSPLVPSAEELSYNRGAFAILARLAPGASLAGARAEMAVIGKRTADLHPDPDRDPTIRVDGLQETLNQAASAPVSKVLMLAVACLLLISCVNVSCLLLGRAAERRREIALRNILGAGPGRLVRQFLCESLLFALAGGAAGVALAHLATAWCTAKMGPLLADDGIREFAIDGRVLGFALILSLATALLSGVLPAWRGARVDLTTALKEGGGGQSAGSSRMRLTGLLVCVEIALSVVLVTSGGLLLNSIREYWRFDWKIPLDRRLAIQITPIDRAYGTDAALARFYGQFLQNVRELPGVESAALVNAMPLHMGAYSVRVKAEGPEPVEAGYRVISPGYHTTAGLGFRGGRLFAESDTDGHPLVALVSDSLAARLWPGRDAQGARIQVNGIWRTVVGVTADLPQDILRKPNYEVSVPYMQAPSKSMRVLLRVTGDPGAAVAEVRKAVRAMDPDLPLGEVQTLQETTKLLGARFEFIIGLLGAFAVSALLLAGAGIYGVTARAVAVRTREIGIRMALGADPKRVMHEVFRGGLKLAVVGTLPGTLLALLMIKILLSKIWWMSPVSSFFWIAPVALLMAVLAVAASLEPARRATRVATVRALRAE
jgi:putative ABC transport system permease protein